MLASVKNIIPALMIVCALSIGFRALEVWSGMKSMSGVALAVEAADESANMAEDEAKDAEMKEANSEEQAPIEISEEEGASEDDDEDDIMSFSGADISPIQAELAQDLVEQRKRLEARERDLMTQDALLKAAQKELDQKYQELLALRTDIEDLLGKQSEEEDARIVSLVKIYEGMKAKQAAAIFNTLDLDILVNVISRMSERKASPIIAAMNPERARTVTILLAEQKQLPTLPGQ